MTLGSDETIEIAWCHDAARVGTVADLFVAHADPTYISHSELQFGRAPAPGRWADDLHARIVALARQAIANPDQRAGVRLALATKSGATLGFAFVSFTGGPHVPFATMEDLLVLPQARSRGVGEALVEWIAAECRSLGVARLYLESGRDNDRAHHFFERLGFVQTSIVMMRDL